MNFIAAALLAAPVSWAPPAASQNAPPPPPQLPAPAASTSTAGAAPTETSASPAAATSAPTPAPAPAPATAPATAPTTGTARAFTPEPATPVAPPTLASSSPEAGADEPHPPYVNYRAEMWRVEVGYRGSFIGDAGYAPFATSQYLGQGSLAASRTIWRQDSWSIAPGIGFELGGSSADARKQTTSFYMDRVSIPIEGRRHFGPWGYAFVRVAPGVAVENMEVDEGSAPASLKKTAWMFSTDVSAGYAWLITPRFDRFERKVRVWLQADVGYGWVAGDELALTAAAGSGGSGGGTVGVDLGPLSMSGPFMRFGGAVSF